MHISTQTHLYASIYASIYTPLYTPYAPITFDYPLSMLYHHRRKLRAKQSKTDDNLFLPKVHGHDCQPFPTKPGLVWKHNDLPYLKRGT